MTRSSRRGRRPSSVPGTQALLSWPCCAPMRVHLGPRSLLGSRATGDLECPPKGTWLSHSVQEQPGVSTSAGMGFKFVFILSYGVTGT